MIPNFNGALLITTVVSGLFSAWCLAFFFQERDVLYRLLMLSSFVVLSNIWIATILLSGLKKYHVLLLGFLVGYTITVGLGFALRHFGLHGLLFGFLLGHLVLLLGMILPIYSEFPSDRWIEFDFLKKGRMYTSLVWAGFFIP